MKFELQDFYEVNVIKGADFYENKYMVSCARLDSLQRITLFIEL